MSLLSQYRQFKRFQAITPSRVDVKWLHDDAITLRTYLQSPNGCKLRDYLLNYVLHQQNGATSSISNAEFNLGACSGTKAILSQIDALGEPDNFTAEEGSD